MTSWMKWTAASMVALAFVLAGSMTVQAEEGGAAGKGSIAVTVLDANGGKVADAMVRVMAAKEKGDKQTALSFEVMGDESTGKKKEKAGKEGKQAAAAEGKTDSDGKFTASGLAAGKYSVQANLKGKGRGKAAATVEDGKTAEVSITLAEAPAKEAK